jgi:hypothetical protein
MIYVPRNAMLSVPMLQVIGLIGWAFIVYLLSSGPVARGNR